MALISFAVTAKLICAFVFAMAKSGFLIKWLICRIQILNVPVKKFSIMSRQKTRSSSRGVETPGPKVIKLFSSSAQLSKKFQLLIDVEIVKISGKFRFKTQKLVIDPAHKC